MMPEMDGFETLQHIREFSNVPVIMLTVKNEEEDKVRGLELGADDYVTKPFSPRELVSRIKALLRRTEMPSPLEKTALKIDDRLSIDFQRHKVWVDGEETKLRPTEYRLLYHLVNNAGWVMNHETLLSKVWGPEYRDEIQYLRLYINYLRQKIEVDPGNPQYILTERGVGYRFVDFEEKQSSA
jgi:two-component system KDP operon response regulator KdpE